MSNDVPPTEPTTTKNAPSGATATAPQPSARASKKGAPKTRYAGDSLVPKLDQNRVAVGRVYFYWLGVTPNCPVDTIQITGVSFSKATENVHNVNGKTKRFPVIGQIVQLREEDIRRLRERLPRTVIRFFEGKAGEAKVEEPGTGLNVGDAYQRKCRGQLITIPREVDIQEMRKQNRAPHLYEQKPNDQPAARYMFAQLCEDQERGNVGVTYPETLEVTGLVWPDEIRD